VSPREPPLSWGRVSGVGRCETSTVGATGLTGGSLGAHSGLTGEVARLQMRHAQAVAVLDIEVYLE